MINSGKNTETLSDQWLKATVTGSLWASFEIIAGSFLHNMRLPFAGTILAAFAVTFLIGFFQLWRESGIIWRAGIICALMKSISPSAVILGPMIGIITEALIIEIAIRLMGKNIIAYITGGALAILSALLHKIVNLIILYGFNLIDIYVNMFNYASRQLSVQESSPINLLYLLSIIYLSIGAIAALTGYFLGLKASKIKITKNTYPLRKMKDEKQEINHQHSVFMLFAHFLIIILSLAFFNVSGNFLIKFLLTLFYSVICLFYYQKLAGRLMKPAFWLQLAIILVLAGIFLQTGKEKTMLIGLMMGMEMIFRAFIVIIGFSAISRELANPKIKNFLTNRRFSKVYLALQLAFSALPVMVEKTNNIKKFIKNPLYSFSSIIAEAENWFETLKQQNSNSKIL